MYIVILHIHNKGALFTNCQYRNYWGGVGQKKGWEPLDYNKCLIQTLHILSQQHKEHRHSLLKPQIIVQSSIHEAGKALAKVN